MRKGIFIMVIFIFISSSLYAAAAAELYTNCEKYTYEDPKLILAPQNAIDGISMTSPYYIKRQEGEQLTLVENATLQDWAKDDNTYVNDHIVVTGGLYDFVIAYWLEDEELQQYLPNEDNATLFGNRWFAIIDTPNVEITIDSSSDFKFISQSNSTYQRPLELTAVPYDAKGTKSESEIDEETINKGNSIVYSSSSNNVNSMKFSVDFESYSTRYADMWFDLLLSLPYDKITSTGIISDGIIYDLQEAEDYSSLVTITISYTPVYTIYSIFSSIAGGIGIPIPRDIKIQKPAMETTITIPFSGFYSRLSSDNKTDSIASFYVNQRPSASNLSLNSSVTRQFIDIADISMLYNCGRSESEPSIGEGDGDIAKIFLSSRSNPYDTTASDFMLVHEDASSIIEGRNALGYTIRVTDSTDGTSEIYDGSDYIDSVGKMLSDGNFIKSHCHKAHPGHLNEWSHFHTFEGTVSLLIDESKQLMVPGIYRSNVYIHLITEETT